MRIGKVNLVELGYLDFAAVVGPTNTCIARDHRVGQVMQTSLRFLELDSELMDEYRVRRDKRNEERNVRAIFTQIGIEG